MEIKELEGVVKDYAWGNADFIPSLIGGYDGKPKAEYWMGTHPSGIAKLSDGTLLSDYISSDDAILGLRNIGRFGYTLPLLFKVLAVGSPLSLQCHPDRVQAETGWMMEENRRLQGLPCNYTDPNQKAELFVSLTPVSAMFGFRENEEIKRNLEKVIPNSYDRFFRGRAKYNEKLFMMLYALDGVEKAELLSEFSSHIERSTEPLRKGEFLTERGMAKVCLEKFPGDVGALFPYILNVIYLEPGEGVYLKPDTIHAYVYGNGIEIMDASDNVLRCGLTHKRIDLEELSRIMVFDAEPALVTPTYRDEWGINVYETPSDTFTLMSADSGLYSVDESYVSIGLVVEGKVEFEVKGETIIFDKGKCFFIPRSVRSYYMRVFGKVFFAVVPEMK